MDINFTSTPSPDPTANQENTPSILTPGSVDTNASASPPVILSGDHGAKSCDPESYDPVRLRDALLVRASEIFGAAEEIRIAPNDLNPLGFFLDRIRIGLTSPYPNGIIAVRCGGQSNLCALVIDTDNTDAHEKLAKANAWASSTVWTLWNGFVFIWLRIEGWAPPSCDLLHCWWISGDCLLPAADVEDPKYYPCGFPIHGKGSTVVTVKFDDINWPNDLLEGFMLKRIADVHGPLFRADETKQVYLCHETVAQFFVELLHLTYSRRDDTFYTSGADAAGPITKSKLTNLIVHWLQQQAEAAHIPYPPDAPVQALVNRMKQLSAEAQIDEAEGVQMFLYAQLERKSGASVTAEELYDAYQAFINARGAACCSRQIFQQRIAIALRERYGVCRSHSVRRSNLDGSWSFKTGYRGLAFAGGVGGVGTVGGLQPLSC